MTVRVNLPPGCGGFTSADGSRYDAKPGTSVEVSDKHAARLRTSANASSGLITVDPGTQIGTRRGRWCASCRRLWQAWSALCPRCGAPTEEE
jgi:hypothetical protein